MTRILPLIILGSFLGLNVFADDDAIEKEETALHESANKANWTETLKTTYSLTDEQVAKMKEQGLSNPQMAIASQLAKTSNKPLDEILKMRTEDKMGWGKIAKELGVSPSEIGHAVSGLRHQIRDERREAKKERKQDRKEEREQRRNEKLNKGKGKGN